MNYRRLGRSNFKVSEIGQGLWGMGNWRDSDDNESRRALQAAADMGCNFFDSAWAYGDGKCDRLLGELLRNNPGKRIYTASKIPPKNGKWPASPREPYESVFPADYVLKYVELIRKAMGVDSIDLLQFHVWDDSWASNERWVEIVDQLKAEGLIRAFGISLNRWEPNNGIKALYAGCVDVVQVIYNIFDQSPEDDLLPACRKLNIGVIARVPLDEGSLAGKMTADTKFPEDDWRSGYFNPENLAATLQRVEKLRPLVPEHLTMAGMALKYILSNPHISTTIVGMRKLEHLQENIGLSDGRTLRRELLHILRSHRWDRKPASWSK